MMKMKMSVKNVGMVVITVILALLAIALYRVGGWDGIAAAWEYAQGDGMPDMVKLGRTVLHGTPTPTPTPIPTPTPTPMPTPIPTPSDIMIESGDLERLLALEIEADWEGLDVVHLGYTTLDGIPYTFIALKSMGSVYWVQADFSAAMIDVQARLAAIARPGDMVDLVLLVYSDRSHTKPTDLVILVEIVCPAEALNTEALFNSSCTPYPAPAGQKWVFGVPYFGRADDVVEVP